MNEANRAVRTLRAMDDSSGTQGLAGGCPSSTSRYERHVIGQNRAVTHLRAGDNPPVRGWAPAWAAECGGEYDAAAGAVGAPDRPQLKVRTRRKQGPGPAG